MRFLLTLAVACTSYAAACSPAAAPWSTFTAAVIYKRNHPASVAAKQAIQNRFCSTFRVHPCTAVNGSPDQLHIARDFDISVPQHLFTDVVVWLQQYRYGSVNGANYSVDLMIHPNTGCPSTDTSYAVYVGHKTAYNTNQLATDLAAVAPPLSVSPAQSVDDSMFVACSSDATCYPPYANHTGCTDAANVGSMHFHFYYTSNDRSAVDASNSLIRMTTSKFNLNLTVCADNTGHEQAHNQTCWLSGPGGSGPIATVELDTESPRGSFAVPSFALYVTRADFQEVLSFMLQAKSKPTNGYGEVDFLVHPNCGCNYADHVFWGLHASTYIPANRQGVAEEAGWTQTWAPPVDPWSKVAPGNWPVDGCGLQGDSFEDWAMHLFYNGGAAASVKAKNELVSVLSPLATVGKESPTAFQDPRSVALTSEQVLLLNSSALQTALPLALQHRPEDADVDWLLVPLSGGGAPCRHTDYVSRAMYAGAHWELNEHALQHPSFEPLGALTPHPAGAVVSGTARSEACSWPPRAYLLYMTASNDNGYQMYSAGLDSFKSGMIQGFDAKFHPEACPANPKHDLEPSYDSLCWVGVNETPFMNNTDPMMQSYGAAFVPAGQIVDVLSWAMDNRVSGKYGYDVDLRLVPLTGCPQSDFVSRSLKAGPDWRLNTNALLKN